MPFKMHKIIIFFPVKKKYVCLLYVKIPDQLPESHIFSFGLIRVQKPPLNAHVDKFSSARGLIVGVSLPLLVCNNLKLWQDRVQPQRRQI